MISSTDTVYEGHDRQVSWRGVSMTDCEDFEKFVSEEVAARLHDEEEREEFKTYLRGVRGTGLGSDALEAVLTAHALEERDWAVCEALAESFLSCVFGIIFPWNMNRDKRNPKASLPGADLVGFRVEDDRVLFAFGEVKSSSEKNRPPGVMKGAGGMPDQLGKLATDFVIVGTLLQWLFSRCRGTEHEELLDSAIKLFFDYGTGAISLYGVLVRDTRPDEKDLLAGARALAEAVRDPKTCRLFAVYIPCSIGRLPALAVGK